MPSIPHVRIIDRISEQETSVLGNQQTVVGGSVADGVVSTDQPVAVGGRDSGGVSRVLNTDNQGSLILSPEISGTPVLDPTTIAGQTIAAGANADFDTADIASTNSSELVQVTIAGEQTWTAFISTVVNGVATQVTAPVTGAAGVTFEWNVLAGAVALNGGTAGLDAFRVNVTNTDNNKTGDFYVNVSYRTLS